MPDEIITEIGFGLNNFPQLLCFSALGLSTNSRAPPRYPYEAPKKCNSHYHRKPLRDVFVYKAGAVIYFFLT